MAATKRAAEEPEAAKTKQRVTPAACRKLLRTKLRDEYGAIVGAFVRAAKKGSVAHMKLATELLEAGQKGPSRGGSALRMLRELQRDERD